MIDTVYILKLLMCYSPGSVSHVAHSARHFCHVETQKRGSSNLDAATGYGASHAAQAPPSFVFHGRLSYFPNGNSDAQFFPSCSLGIRVLDIRQLFMLYQQ